MYSFEKLRCRFIHYFKGRGLICSAETWPCCARQLCWGLHRLRRTRVCSQTVLCRNSSSLSRSKSSIPWGIPLYPSSSKTHLQWQLIGSGIPSNANGHIQSPLFCCLQRALQLSLKGVSFETGTLYASRSDFICDQTHEQWSCADLEMGVGPCGGFCKATAPLAAVWVWEGWGSVWAHGAAGAFSGLGWAFTVLFWEHWQGGKAPELVLLTVLLQFE